MRDGSRRSDSLDLDDEVQTVELRPRHQERADAHAHMARVRSGQDVDGGRLPG